MKTILTVWMISFMMLFIYGCTKSHKIYDEMMEQGHEQIKQENYKIATDFFKNALNEKQNDEKAATLFQQTQKMTEAKRFFDEGKLDAANQSVERVVNMKDGSDILVKNAKQLRKQIADMEAAKKKYAESYEEAKKTFQEERYDESIAILESILQQDLSHPFFSDIKHDAETSLSEMREAKATALKEAEELARARAEADKTEKKQFVLKEKTVGAAEGYWLTADKAAACHLTNDYLACAVKESDDLFKDQIVEVNWLNDVELELTFADGYKTKLALVEKNVLHTEGGRMYRVSKEEANSIYEGHYKLP